MGILNNNSEEWKKMTEGLEEVKKKRGQIITWALEIEELLEGILSNYFMKGTTPESRAFFEVEIMRNMNFEQKVQIFEKVAHREKYDSDKLSLIIKAIKNIQDKRNKVAHWRTLSFLQTGEVLLRKKNEIEKKEMLSLSKEILEKLEMDKEIAFQEIIIFHQWFQSLK